MKMPKWLKVEIRKCANFNLKAKISEERIIKWLERNKLTEDSCEDLISDMTDSFIDNCQMTCNPDELIKTIEQVER